MRRWVVEDVRDDEEGDGGGGREGWEGMMEDRWLDV